MCGGREAGVECGVTSSEVWSRHVGRVSVVDGPSTMLQRAEDPLSRQRGFVSGLSDCDLRESSLIEYSVVAARRRSKYSEHSERT